MAIARLRNPEVIELLSTTIANLVEGEFMQLKILYYKIIIMMKFLMMVMLKVFHNQLEKVPTKLHQYSVQQQQRTTNGGNGGDSADAAVVVDHEINVEAAFEYYLHKTYLKTASLMSKLCSRFKWSTR